MPEFASRSAEWKANLQHIWRFSVRLSTLFFVLIVGPPALLHGQSAPTGGDFGCPGDTVDRLEPTIARQARDFLERLSKAVQNDNEKQVASMLQYPLGVGIASRTFRVHNPEEFLRNYRRIVNPTVKAAILDKKSSRCLFFNPQGFMVGDGEVWFKETSQGVFKVITFNLGYRSNGGTISGPA